MKHVIISQYQAALTMLREAVDSCSDELWVDPSYRHRFWRVAYHTLFFTDMYLTTDEHTFRAWNGHSNHMQDLAVARLDDQPYQRTDIQHYADAICNKIRPSVTDCEMDAPSGFHWLPFTKLELQLYNIRHVQHHAGQLIERMRQHQNHGIGWTGYMAHAKGKRNSC